MEETDKERYQTVYAEQDGSVAAPTAGLHFTGQILKELKNKHIHTGFVTLHVGAGTFKPVKAETMQDHEMHAEFIEVTAGMIEKILAAHRSKNDIVVVGTTSLRTIESLYWIAVKLSAGDHTVATAETILSLSQWEPYTLAALKIPVADALEGLLHWMKENNREKLVAKTQVIIAPGYQPKIAKGLVTNFHQPGSTLLLLVAALIGDNWKKVYNYALENDFRFLSYGDGSLLWFDQA